MEELLNIVRTFKDKGISLRTMLQIVKEVYKANK